MAESNAGGPTSPPQAGPGRSRLVLVLSAVIVALTAALVVAVVTRNGDDSATTTSSSISSSSSSASSSTAATSSGSSSTSSSAQPVDTSTAVWPVASSATRYADPVAAARGFAVDLAGFRDPVVGSFRAGDSRSGEVDVQSKATGPITTVLVRQLSGSDSWWVIGAGTEAIQPTAPAPLATITSPVHLQGSSTAFEATVRVEVREDGNPDPLGVGIVMGGANGEMGPFDSTLDYHASTSTYGTVAFSIESMEDGRVMQVTVVRVRLG